MEVRKLMGEAKRKQEADKNKFLLDAEKLATLKNNEAFKIYTDIIENSKDIYEANSKKSFIEYKAKNSYKKIDDGMIIPLTVTQEEYNNYRNENMAKMKALSAVLGILEKVEVRADKIKESEKQKEENEKVAQRRYEELNGRKK